MIAYTPHGFPRPVGSAFRRREVNAPHDGEHSVPWAVSVVTVLGGTFIEAKTHLRTDAIVASELELHSSFATPPVLGVVRPLLDQRGWADAVVPECVRIGCNNPCPMWTVRGRADNASMECLNCQARSVLSCIECGAPELAHYSNREILLQRQLCFGCNLWFERARDFGADSAGASLVFVGNDWRYHTIRTPGIGGSSVMKGYGGQPWRITFENDGRVMLTDDLWDGGEVPEWFRDRLPQTATLEGISRG